MKHPFHFILLRILATSAIGSFIYAAAVTIRSAVFKTDGGLILAAGYMLIMIFGHLTGRTFLRRIPVFAIRASVSKPVKFISFMFNLKDSAYTVSAITAWAIILLPLFVTFLVFIKLGSLRLAFELLVTAIAFIAALKHSQLPFTQIMSNHKAYAGFVIMALCLETLNFFKEIAYLRPWLLGISYYFILAYFLIKNQEDIESNIFDKKHIEKSILPRNLRRFNSFWVCMLFLAVILLFNLKPLVVFLLQLAGKISVYILVVLAWLIEKILPLQSSQQQAAGSSGFSFFGNAPELVQPLRNLISNVIRNSILLYILYRFLLLLVKWAPRLILKVYGLIKKLFAIKKVEKVFETSDYSDETETIRPVREQEQQKYLRKKMRKNSRTLRGISDPVERVRYMYASILTMLPVLGIRPERSDTTADILEKTGVKPQVSNELYPFTRIYNEVRYGEKVPDGGTLGTAEVHFDKAVEVIGKK